MTLLRITLVALLISGGIEQRLQAADTLQKFVTTWGRGIDIPATGDTEAYRNFLRTLRFLEGSSEGTESFARESNKAIDFLHAGYNADDKAAKYVMAQLVITSAHGLGDLVVHNPRVGNWMLKSLAREGYRPACLFLAKQGISVAEESDTRSTLRPSVRIMFGCEVVGDAPCGS